MTVLPRPIERLLAVMDRLRDPQHGCAWDVAQTSASIAPYAIEEAYELVDAIERGTASEVCDELGDLLLQVVFHARIAEETGLFDFDAVATAIADKMERRHPHVFEARGLRPPDGESQAWERLKAAERSAKAPTTATAGVLDGIASTLPALTRAVKLTGRAARVGFDWPHLSQVFAKLEEEIQELKAEVVAADEEKIVDEFGDLMFVCANLARKLGIDPETALRRANAKFMRRFIHIETALALEGRTPEQSDLAEMDALWNAAKVLERSTLAA